MKPRNTVLSFLRNASLLNRFLLLASAVCVFGLPRLSLADWSSSGNIVASGPGTEQTGFGFGDGDSPVAPDGSGGCFVAYTLPGGDSIRINHLRGGTGDGRLWGRDGLEVNPGGNASGPPHVLADGAGGCWVVWEDTRTGASGIYVQRFSFVGKPILAVGGRLAVGVVGTSVPTGPVIARGVSASQLVIAYTRNGRPQVTRIRNSLIELTEMPLSGGNGTPFQLFSDGANGGIVVWTSDRRTIRANRFDSTGARLWGIDGAVVQSAVDLMVRGAQAFWDGTSLFVSWARFLDPFPDLPPLPNTFPEGIRAQKLNGSGVAQWGSTATGVTVMNRVDTPESDYLNSNTDQELRPHIASDGGTGIWVAWVDSRDFHSPTPGGFLRAQDLYAQRLDASGVPQFQANGAPVDAQPGTVSELQVVPGIAKELLIVYRSLLLEPVLEPDSAGDIFANRISTSGTTGGAFVLNKPPGTPNDNAQFNPQVIADGVGGVFVAWEDLRDPLNQDVYVTHRTGQMGRESPPPAIVTDPISVALPEGGTGTFVVRLTDPPPPPSVTVNVRRSSGDADITVQSGTDLIFTPANWNEFQGVKLSAALDLDSINGMATIRCSEQRSIFGPRFTSADVTATEIDAGPPDIRINDISVTTVPGLALTKAFTVSLSHASDSPTTVHFATRDGTAKARTLSNLGDYLGTSGTLTIPALALSSNINVRILGRAGGTFFMDLSNEQNGRIVDGTGKCTIKIETLTTGTFDLSPDNARVRAGEIVDYAVTWTVPEGEVWRNLKTIDLRVRDGRKTALWVRWDEASNTFSVCQKDRKDRKGDDDDNDDDGPASDVHCTPGELPGSPVVLETRFARLHVAESSVVGSGPTGLSVTLNLAISFGPKAAGHYRVELAAADDFGNEDEFVQASDLLIKREKGSKGSPPDDK